VEGLESQGEAAGNGHFGAVFDRKGGVFDKKIGVFESENGGFEGNLGGFERVLWVNWDFLRFFL
jgi:hypothetical protein